MPLVSHWFLAYRAAASSSPVDFSTGLGVGFDIEGGGDKVDPSRTRTDPRWAPKSDPDRLSWSSRRRIPKATPSVLLPPVSLLAAFSISATTSGRLMVMMFAMRTSSIADYR